MVARALFSSATDEWATPDATFAELDREFSFDVDVCATPENAKCEHFYSKTTDALTRDWVEDAKAFGRCVVWMNPPFSRIAEFIAKAADESRKGATVVALIPARPDTRYWAAHIWDHANHRPHPGVEVRFIKGRLKFGGSKNSAPFPSAVVIFRGAR
jgi:phage N-6-adenine-methyltransferase